MSQRPMQETDTLQLIFVAIAFLYSVIAHEVSHGYMAQYLGDPTARYAGRLTMNPLKHIDPVGSVLVPLVMVLSNTGFVFGWAKPVPYNPYNLRDQKWGDTKVALAGPLTNFGIALFFGLLLRFGAYSLDHSMITILAQIVSINLLLGVFNMVPIPPLDGSKILLNVLPYRYRYIFNYLERYSLLIVVFFVLFFWSAVSPLVSVLFNLIVGV